DTQELEKNIAQLKDAIKLNTIQDKQEQAKMLEESQKLKDALQELLEKKESSAKELEKKIDNLQNVTYEQIRQLQESLKKAQQSKDTQELEKNIAQLKDAIKLNTIQDKQEQAKMLEESQKLKDALQELLEKKAPTAEELKTISKINEEVAKTAEIKQQFIMSKALADVLGKIEELSVQDQNKAQALKEKLEQLRKSNSPAESEKIIKEFKEDSDNENPESKNQEKKEDEKPDQKNNQKWKISILSAPLIVSQGVAVPLKVISIDSKGYVKELTSDLEWFSTQKQVAWVDDANFLHPLMKGRARIRAVYKGSSSKDVEVSVVENIDPRAVQSIKQEIPVLNL
ncbi:MAG: hypothetical protein PHS66_00150, partial [Candidatus Omnitrophica bacterium]|nr:hypothetical protein [Candidatus Omnitrophota bacterium]